MAKIFVAGHKGMVGSAICRNLNIKDNSLITADRSELNLINQQQVIDFFQKNSFDQVYLAAARVGGIYANNTYPAEFIYENLMIQNNIINSAYQSGVQKLLFLGSSCIYPKFAKQPINENELLNGYLESTNEPYAISKIAGIKMCESYNRQYNTDYRNLMPTNLYGPGDNYHSLNSHVIPALIKKIHDAKINNHKEVTAWGTGRARREFLYVDDMAAACIFIMNLDKKKYKESIHEVSSHINVGVGHDITIKELTKLIADVIGFSGQINWDTSKPDGTPKKLLSSKTINDLGWQPKIELYEGIKLAYEDFKINNQK